MESHIRNLIHNLKTPLSTIDIAINTTLELITLQPTITNEHIDAIVKLLNNANIANQEIQTALKAMRTALQGEK